MVDKRGQWLRLHKNYEKRRENDPDFKKYDNQSGLYTFLGSIWLLFGLIPTVYLNLGMVTYLFPVFFLLGKSFHFNYKADNPSKGLMNGVFAVSIWPVTAIILGDAVLLSTIISTVLYIGLRQVNPEGVSLISVLKKYN